MKVPKRNSKIMYRNLFIKCEDFFGDIGSLNLNVFEINLQGNENILVKLCNTIFEKQDLFTSLNLSQEKLTSFITKISEGYFDNPYHNKMHAFDVCQVKPQIITNKYSRLCIILW
jgi:hypothetical protein